MTTLKDYKTMMEGATEGPWEVIWDEDLITWIVKSQSTSWNICDVCCCIDKDESGETHANIIAASRNIAPKLIRVIELAEDALCARLDPEYSFDEDMELARKALSEIRKLKGE